MRLFSLVFVLALVCAASATDYAYGAPSYQDNYDDVVSCRSLHIGITLDFT